MGKWNGNCDMNGAEKKNIVVNNAATRQPSTAIKTTRLPLDEER
jgi:hypothetical protein